MAAMQRTVAVPLISRASLMPLRMPNYRRNALAQTTLQLRLLSGQSAARPSLAAALHRSTPLPFTSNRTSALAKAIIQSNLKGYSTDPQLPTYFPPTQPTPEPSRTRSFLRGFFKVAGAIVVLVLGKFFGYALLTNDYIRAGWEQKRYADEQVKLIMEGRIEEYAEYQEPGAAPKSEALKRKTKEILTYILGHPDIRARMETPAALDGWEIVDPPASASNNKMPADFLYFHMLRFLREHNMLTDVMSSENAMPVPPLTWRNKEDNELVMVVYTGKDLCGHENIVHGGFVATLLDEALARCCFSALPGKMGVTASLNIDYRAPTPADGYVVIKAKVHKTEGRKAFVGAIMETLPPANSGKAPHRLAQAEALFVSPSAYAPIHDFFVSRKLEKNIGL